MKGHFILDWTGQKVLGMKELFIMDRSESPRMKGLFIMDRTESPRNERTIHNGQERSAQNREINRRE
jgi:hypothetical protein